MRVFVVFVAPSGEVVKRSYGVDAVAASMNAEGAVRRGFVQVGGSVDPHTRAVTGAELLPVVVAMVFRDGVMEEVWSGSEVRSSHAPS